MILFASNLLLDFRIQPLKCDGDAACLIKNIEIEKIISKDKTSIEVLYQQGDARKDFLNSRKKEWLKAIYILYAIILENIIIFCIVVFPALKNIFSKHSQAAEKKKIENQ